MALKGKAFKQADKFTEENKQRMDEAIRGMYRGVIVMNGKPARFRPLHGPDKAIRLYLHYWKGSDMVRAICVDAHYGEHCEICNTSNSYGEPCYAKYVECYISYAYSLLGETYVSKRGKNKGKKMKCNPYAIVDVPSGGKDKPYWMILDNAVTEDYFDDESLVWVLDKVEGSAISAPSQISVKALGKQVTHPDKAEVKKIAAMSEDEVAAHILASCSGVRWEDFGLEPPKVEKTEGQDDDDDDEEPVAAPKKKAKPAPVEDEEEEETPPPKAKKKAPVEDDEDEAPAPKKKAKAAPPEDEEEEAPPPKAKKRPPVVEDDDEEDDVPPPPPKKKPVAKPVVEDEDDEEVPPPKAKKKAAAKPAEDEEDEEAPPPKKKAKAKPVVEDDEEEEAPPPKKKKAAVVADDDDEDYAPPPKKRDKLKG